MKKRIFAMLLALAMIISMVPMTALAAECDHAGATVLKEEPATCAFDGYKIFMCPNCGVKNEVYPATGEHVFVDGMCACGQWEETDEPETEGCVEHQMLGKREEIITPAACNQEGLKQIYMTCTNEGCDFELPTEKKTIPALIHQMVGTREEIITPAACNQEGLKQIYMTCTNEGCDLEVPSEQKTIPALIHQMLGTREEIITAATCGHEGLKQIYITCVNEGCELELPTEQKTIPAIGGHGVETYSQTYDPTCAKTGYKDIFCKACDELISHEVLPVNDEHFFHEGNICLLCGAKAECDHNYEVIKTQDATCVAPAYVWYACTLCGAEKNGEEGDVSEIHNYEVVKTQDATCVAPAYVWYACTLCGAEKNGEEGAVSNTHKYEVVKTQEATCVEPAYVWYACSLCGAEKNGAEGEVSKIHNYEVVKTQEATCVEPAYVWYACTLCGAEKNGAEGEVSTTHKYEVVKTQEATCKDPAYVWYECSVCGAEKNGEEGEVSTTHKYEIVKKLDATCQMPAYVWYACSVCGAEKNGEEGTVSATHNYKKGFCVDCGKKISIEECDHAEENLTKDQKLPTCTEGGHNIVTCICGFVVRNEKCGALEHMKLEKVDPATCTEEGLLHVVCRRCNELLLEKVIPIKDHDKLDKSYPATCTQDGLEHVVCTSCNTVLRDEVIPSTGHQFESEKCIICEMNCQHENGEEKSVDATCTEAGFRSFKCPDCNFEKMEEWPALGHDWETVEIKAATCAEAGYHSFRCSVCNAEKVEELTALAHNWRTIQAKPATCTANGHNEYKQCSDCNATLNKETIPAAHDFSKNPYKCSVCQARNPGCQHANGSITVTKEPTCKASGTQTFKCNDCGDTFAETLPQLTYHNYVDGTCTWCKKESCNHSYVHVSVEPTCTEMGYSLDCCTICGKETNRRTYHALNHNWNNDVVHNFCTRCGTANPAAINSDKMTDDLQDIYGLG